MNSFYICLLLLGTTLQIREIFTIEIDSLTSTPEITFISPNQTKEVGGTVYLQCSVKNAQDTPVCWTKAGEYPLYISTGSLLLLRDSRYSIRHDETSSTFTLKIEQLQLHDAGLYQCLLAISPNNLPSADVALQVRQAETMEIQVQMSNDSQI